MSALVFVAGARPNFMKIAPLLRAVAARPDAPPARLVHTGQHYDDAMSRVFFEQLAIRDPDVHLDVGSGSHAEQTARVMIEFERDVVALPDRPRAIVVVGDVNSTMACALVAAKLRIPLAHVEAGLRSHDRAMPEEINRIVTDRVADLLLVSEPDGLVNLRREGVDEAKLRYVGNVMIDSLVDQLAAARALGMPARLGVPGRYAVVTLHRPSNVDAPARLAAVVAFLERTAAELDIVFPVHPRTAARLRELGLRARLDAAPRIRVLEPLGYRENLGLMAGATVVISDSGGIQEETTYLGVPCVTLRPNTERPVTVTSGTNTVVGEDLDAAWAVVAEILAGRYKTGQPIDGWDGRAAERIVDALLGAW